MGLSNVNCRRGNYYRPLLQSMPAMPNFPSEDQPAHRNVVMLKNSSLKGSHEIILALPRLRAKECVPRMPT